MKESRYIDALMYWKGYTEEPNGNTCFGRMYASRHKDKAYDNAEWCMMFLCENARMLGIPVSVIPDTASCPTFFEKMKQYAIPKGEKAKAGDIVVFMWKSNTDGRPDHVGLVKEVNADELRIVEGNHSVKGFSSPCVYDDRVIKTSDAEVFAIIRPPYGSTDEEIIIKDLKEITQLLYKGE